MGRKSKGHKYIKGKWEKGIIVAGLTICDYTFFGYIRKKSKEDPVTGIVHADVGNVSNETKEKYYAVNTDLAIETVKKSSRMQNGQNC